METKERPYHRQADGMKIEHLTVSEITMKTSLAHENKSVFISLILHTEKFLVILYEG